MGGRGWAETYLGRCCATKRTIGESRGAEIEIGHGARRLDYSLPPAPPSRPLVYLARMASAMAGAISGGFSAAMALAPSTEGPLRISSSARLGIPSAFSPSGGAGRARLLAVPPG